jgi:uncharacterized membrane protein HdeD (DUF308 family)
MISENKMIIMGIISVLTGILSIFYSIKNLKKMSNWKEEEEAIFEFSRNRFHMMWFMGGMLILFGLFFFFN